MLLEVDLSVSRWFVALWARGSCVLCEDWFAAAGTVKWSRHVVSGMARELCLNCERRDREVDGLCERCHREMMESHGMMR